MVTLNCKQKKSLNLLLTSTKLRLTSTIPIVNKKCHYLMVLAQNSQLLLQDKNLIISLMIQNYKL